MSPSRSAEVLLLRAAAGQHEPQARVAPVRLEEGVGEQVGALLLGQAPGVEHVQLAGQQPRRALARAEAGEVHAAVPAADPRSVDPELDAATSSEAELGERTTLQWP